VDVKSAFDTIPQDAVVELMKQIPQKDSYKISKHVQVKPGISEIGPNKPIRRWISLAKDSDDRTTFPEQLNSTLAATEKHTIFIDTIIPQHKHRDDLLALLSEHVQKNIVRIGKKFYRQRTGIPQGSVLSSLLCNYFYADLEAKHFSFLQPTSSLLLRLVDDFLLITADRGHAKRFLQIMHDGLPAYGVTVNPEKTLVNFEVAINERKVRRLVTTGRGDGFPYCGSVIDTRTLDVGRDLARRGETGGFCMLVVAMRD
jgi:telomerase reverse transcriptase